MATKKGNYPIITAAEARAITDGEMTTDMLREHISKNIRKLAENGKSEYVYITTEPLEIAEELEKNGYEVIMLIYPAKKKCPEYMKYFIKW